MDLTELIKSDNIAESLDEDTLKDIGATVLEGYQFDKESRSDWEEQYEEGLKLARQLGENRTYAGEKISDIKYPTIASAAIQYASRAYPNIVKGDEVMRCKVVGPDPEGQKASRAKRVQTHMNYQILEQMEDWEEGMDQLLVCHSIVGVYYKKTYFDPVERINKCDLVSPEDLVMYYYEKSAEKAKRKTHVLDYTHNTYVEMVNSGAWLDIDLTKPQEGEQDSTEEEREDGTHRFLEQHRLLDLDDDGYEEPYVVTIHEDTRQVVRILARYDERSIVERNGKLVKIKPIEYFTEYPFMPAFDGGVYRMGFGALLSPLNHAINTLFNQLIDAGSLAVRGGGFLGKNVRLLRGGESGTLTFKQGEWKQVQCTGDDLRKGVFPLPVREPSAVLFQLLGLLLDASKELASQSELLSGQQTQHNVPATSTLALIEQGLKVFSGIYKRIYRALKKELRKLYYLNSKYLTNLEYGEIVDVPGLIESGPDAPVKDYQTGDRDINPVSSTTAITETQKYLKAEAVRSWYRQGGNDKKIMQFWFEALEVPDAAEFVNGPQQPPDPKLVQMLEELKLKNMELQLKQEELFSKNRERESKQVKMRADAIKSMAEAEAEEVGQQMDMYLRQVSMINQQVSEMNQIAKEIELARIQQGAGAGDTAKSGGMGANQGVSPGGQAAAPTQGMA